MSRGSRFFEPFATSINRKAKGRRQCGTCYPPSLRPSSSCSHRVLPSSTETILVLPHHIKPAPHRARLPVTNSRLKRPRQDNWRPRPSPSSVFLQPANTSGAAGADVFKTRPNYHSAGSGTDRPTAKITPVRAPPHLFPRSRTGFESSRVAPHRQEVSCLQNRWRARVATGVDASVPSMREGINTHRHHRRSSGQTEEKRAAAIIPL